MPRGVYNRKTVKRRKAAKLVVHSHPALLPHVVEGLTKALNSDSRFPPDVVAFVGDMGEVRLFRLKKHPLDGRWTINPIATDEVDNILRGRA